MTLPQLEVLELPEPFGDLPEEDIVAIGALRRHPALQHLTADNMPPAPAAASSSADGFWTQWDRLAAVVLPLRRAGLEVTLRKPDRSRLRLTIKGEALHDLAILKNAPVAELDLQGCEAEGKQRKRGRLRDVGFGKDEIVHGGDDNACRPAVNGWTAPVTVRFVCSGGLLSAKNSAHRAQLWESQSR